MASRVQFRRLLPAGEPLDAAELLDAWQPSRHPPAGRPYIALNMITSVDGRGAIDGRTRALGNRGDRELFHRLRAQADAVMAGASTIRMERYGPILRDPELKALRAERGEPVQPLAVTASRTLAFDPGLPLLSDPESHLVVLTPSAGELAPCAARVSYLRGSGSLPEMLGDLRGELGVRSIVCEGGPALNGELLAAGVIDEVFVSFSPLLIGGRDPLTIVEGATLPTKLELVWLVEYESLLHARYRVLAPGA